MIAWGYKAQRCAYRVAKKLGLIKINKTSQPPATVGTATHQGASHSLHQ